MKRSSFAFSFLLVLFAAASASAATSTWTGGGFNDQWGTSTNWNGSFTPSANNDLIFPSGASQTATFNDFPQGTDFASLQFTGASGGYVLDGNYIDLSSGVLAGQSSGVNEIGLNVVLLQSQIWTVTNAAAQLTVDSVVVDLAGHDLTFGGSGTLLFSAVLSNSSGVAANVLKDGPGFLILDQDQPSFAGTLQINGGVLKLSNGLTQGTGQGTTVLHAGTAVTGDGRASGLLLALDGSRVLPGEGPGDGLGRLTVALLNLQQGSTLGLEINGTSAGTDYDQLSIFGGTVVLQEPTLGLTLGFTPAVGDSFTIIDNDQTDAISGTFDGLPEGGTLVMDGVTFQISYIGGDGNDVTLTVLSVTSSGGSTGDGGATGTGGTSGSGGTSVGSTGSGEPLPDSGSSSGGCSLIRLDPL
jgi:hypothetical protein